jgi:hypothetical protein
MVDETSNFSRQNLRARYWSEEELLRLLVALFEDVDIEDFDIRVCINRSSDGHDLNNINHS